MKLAVIADTHLGYSRFEEDAFAQAEFALRDAAERADALIVAGDVFDVKIPKLETIKRAADMFSSLGKPVYLIHGNHERRSRDMVNPVQLLATLANLHYVHGSSVLLEKDGERVALVCMGSVPEEHAKDALRKVMEAELPKVAGAAFKILLIHQSLRELVYGEEEELSIDDLRDLPFDLVVNGHIHGRHEEMGGRLLIPGSTVITQLKNDEQGERCYALYDTGAKKAEFVAIPSRQFFYKEMDFENAPLQEVRDKVDAWISETRAKHRDAIIKVKLTGTLREGLGASDLSLSYGDGIYVQNSLNAEKMGEKIRRMREEREEKLSMREIAVRQLGERLRGKITLFDPAEMFEALAEGAEAGAQCLNKKKTE